MNWTVAWSWLVHSAVGGGAILLLTCALTRRTRQPARRQRLGEIGLAAALLVAALSLFGPAWLIVSLPVSPPPVAQAPAEAPLATGEPQWVLVEVPAEQALASPAEDTGPFSSGQATGEAATSDVGGSTWPELAAMAL